MFDIDENSFKLLKMMESLFKTNNIDDNTLIKYKDIVEKIDRDSFDKIRDMINDVSINNYPLEQELSLLEDIQTAYNQLELLQHRFINICELYPNCRLDLSDLSLLEIDKVANRLSFINGYLVNASIIENYKKELAKLNEQLIIENKKSVLLRERIIQYEHDLKNSFLNAEGRILDNGEIKYTSVIEEYRENNIDIKKVLDDDDSINHLLDVAEKNKIEMDEELSAAELCYTKIPDIKSKAILDEIKNNTVKSRYYLSLVKILKLLSFDEGEYDRAKEKRQKLLDLIKYRCDCLDKLKIKFAIDPFSRIKIKKQIEQIDEFGDNERQIRAIRKKINEYSVLMDEKIKQNDEFLSDINDSKINSIVKKVEIQEEEIPSLQQEEKDVDTYNFDELKKDIIDDSQDNQVVGIEDLSNNFMVDRAREKSFGVINRVYEMITEEKTPEDEEFVPDLFIEQQDVFTSDNKFNVDEDNIFVDDVNSDNIFDSSTRTVEIPINSNTENVVDGDLTKDKDLFSDVKPFDDVELFVDKSDDDMFDDNKNGTLIFDNNDSTTTVEESKLIDNGNEVFPNMTSAEEEDATMPELFWETQDEENSEIVDDGVSFEEQLDKLLSSENDDVKTRKLVA